MQLWQCLASSLNFRVEDWLIVIGMSAKILLNPRFSVTRRVRSAVAEVQAEEARLRFFIILRSFLS